MLFPTFLPCQPLLPRPNPTLPSTTPIPPLATLSPTRPLRNIATLAALSLTLILPHPALARQKQKTITMTDQVPNFTLPSQTLQKPAFPTLLLKTLRRTAPPLFAISLAIYLLSIQFRRAKSRQLRDFQTQLQSLSSMLDLDTPIQQTPTSPKSPSLEQTRFKFRSDNLPTEKSPDPNTLAAKVQLDLFSSKPSTKPSTKPISDPTAPPSRPETPLPTIPPSSDYERAILSAVHLASSPPEVPAAQADLKAAREKGGISEAEGVAMIVGYVSRLGTAYVDRAAGVLDADDRECMRVLHALAGLLCGVSAVGAEGVVYAGVGAEERAREELYRRYALFCLSSEERVAADLRGLVEIQAFLKVDEKRAEEINTELAKGMFQVAVSAAMADGSLDKESRAALDELRESFGGFLDGGSADSIMSEVAVMRAMYSLQQLLQEQGVSDEDVQELRKMCKELGVDIDEMLKNADALGDALGPEAKEFVESLQGLLAGASDDKGTVTTTVKAVDPKDPEGTES